MSMAESMYGDLKLDILPTENDLMVIYYVTGYCCRSLVNSFRCEKCKDATVADISDFDSIPEDSAQLLNDLNRGGLWKPSAELFGIGYLCWRVFAELCKDDLRQNFLKFQNQRRLFCEIVGMAFYEGVVISPWSAAVMCNNGHQILDGIAVRFYNCMCKNLLRTMNECKNVSKVKRKMRKLTGNNAK